MNRNAVASTFMALCLMFGNGAFAADYDRRGPGGQHNRDRHEHNDRHGNQGRGYGNGYADGQRGPGAGPNHDFYRGGHLPPEYRHRNYVVNDWRGHSLRAPPRGYQWVQTGSDYVLVAIATGIIVEVLLNR